MRRLSKASVVSTSLSVLLSLTFLGCAGSPSAAPLAGTAPSTSVSPASEATTSAPTATAPAPKPRASIPVSDADLSANRPVTSTIPARISISEVDIDLPVIEVGVDEEGAMGLPGTVYEVGWYKFGPRPADQVGATVLAAHVDSRRDGLGPFARLRDVEEGAEIAVADRDGTTRRYTVVEVQKINKSTVPLAEVFRRDGPATLRVITCGGAYDRRNGYRDNVIVTAEPSA